MAIYRPKTIGDAPEGPQRSGGCCWRDFLASRGMGVSPGEESRANNIAAQTIEAQPVFGQIEPSQRPRASHAELQVREKMAAFGSARQDVETIQRRKRNERGRKGDVASARPIANERLQLRVDVDRDAIDAATSKCSEEGRDYLPLEFADRVWHAALVDKFNRQIVQDHF
jgi:hypothetical protein